MEINSTLYHKYCQPNMICIEPWLLLKKHLALCSKGYTRHLWWALMFHFSYLSTHNPESLVLYGQLWGSLQSVATQSSTRPVPIIFCAFQSRSPPSRCSSISRYFYSLLFIRLDSSSYFWCLICCPLKSLILCKLCDSTSEIFSENNSQ